MKKQSIVVSIILILILLIFFCSPEKKVVLSEPPKIVLVNPSSGSLQSFLFLIKHHIIEMPNLNMEVIYDSGSIDRYESALRLLHESELSNVHFTIVECNLTGDDLYRINSCSEKFREIFNSSFAMLLFGGADIPPAVYGNKTGFLTDIETPFRHYFELSLLFHLLGGNQYKNFTPFMEQKPDYIIFGFCLGMQTLNVATGGTLIQDIPTETYELNYIEDFLSLNANQIHRNYWGELYPQSNLNYNCFHQIRLLSGSFFTEKLNLKEDYHPFVYSSHHQAVKNVGKGLKIEATSMDGKIIEALSHMKYNNVLGVQFHPENSSIYDENGPIYKSSPSDSFSLSVNDLMKQNHSLEFHNKFWVYFSSLIKNVNKE